MVCGKANWGRGENGKVCNCGWEPRAIVGVKRNEMSIHVRGGNEHGANKKSQE